MTSSPCCPPSDRPIEGTLFRRGIRGGAFLREVKFCAAASCHVNSAAICHVNCQNLQSVNIKTRDTRQGVETLTPYVDLCGPLMRGHAAKTRQPGARTTRLSSYLQRNSDVALQPFMIEGEPMLSHAGGGSAKVVRAVSRMLKKSILQTRA